MASFVRPVARTSARVRRDRCSRARVRPARKPRRGRPPRSPAAFPKRPGMSKRRRSSARSRASSWAFTLQGRVAIGPGRRREKAPRADLPEPRLRAEKSKPTAPAAPTAPLVSSLHAQRAHAQSSVLHHQRVASCTLGGSAPACFHRDRAAVRRGGRALLHRDGAKTAPVTRARSSAIPRARAGAPRARHRRAAPALPRECRRACRCAGRECAARGAGRVRSRCRRARPAHRARLPARSRSPRAPTRRPRSAPRAPPRRRSPGPAESAPPRERPSWADFTTSTFRRPS